MITQSERDSINASLDAAGYRDYEDGLFKHQVVLDDPIRVHYTGSYEGCKQYIRNHDNWGFDILSLETKRLVSYVL
jgi:hypothetical protein